MTRHLECVCFLRSDNRKSKNQNRKWMGLSVIAFVLVVAGAMAQAQQPAKMPRIGYLSTNTPVAMSTRTEAFLQGLRELGYVEGKNIVIEYRYAEGNAIASPRSRPNWCGSMSISSSRRVGRVQRALPSKRLIRSPSS